MVLFILGKLGDWELGLGFMVFLLGKLGFILGLGDILLLVLGIFGKGVLLKLGMFVLEFLGFELLKLDIFGLVLLGNVLFGVMFGNFKLGLLKLLGFMFEGVWLLLGKVVKVIRLLFMVCRVFSNCIILL